MQEKWLISGGKWSIDDDNIIYKNHQIQTSKLPPPLVLFWGQNHGSLEGWIYGLPFLRFSQIGFAFLPVMRGVHANPNFRTCPSLNQCVCHVVRRLALSIRDMSCIASHPEVLGLAACERKPPGGMSVSTLGGCASPPWEHECLHPGGMSASLLGAMPSPSWGYARFPPWGQARLPLTMLCLPCAKRGVEA